jgi:hypothetical protein
MSKISTLVRSMIASTRMILLLLPLMLGGCDWNDSKFIPDNLVGVWRTNDARYRDRSMKFSKDSALIETGVGIPSKESVESVKIQSAGEETNYSIKCRTADGNADLLSVRFSPKWGGELRLNHQPNMIWRRSRFNESSPTGDGHVADPPRPFYEVDCIHRNCSMDW